MTLDRCTLEFWVKPDSTSQSKGTGIISSSDGASGRGTFQVEFDGSGMYRFYPYSGQPVEIGSAATQWQHVAITYDGATLHSYLDGVLTQTHTLSLPDGIRFYDVVLGKNREECGLVGNWRFTSLSGGEAKDSSGFGNHGEPTADVTTTSTGVSFIGSSSPITVFKFDGRKDSIMVPNVSLIDAVECTVELWFRVDSAGSGIIDHLFFAGQNSTGFGGKDDLHLSVEDGELALYYNKDSDSWSLRNGTVQANTWHHAAATWSVSDNAVKLYLDGQLVASRNSYRKIVQDNWENEVRFGRHHNGDSKVDRALDGLMSEVRIWHVARSIDEIQSSMGARLWNRGDQYFAGCLADVRVWTDVRTLDQIRANMNRRLNSDEADLTGYWPLDGTSSDTQSNTQANSLIKHLGTWTVDNTLPVFGDDEMLALALNGSSDYVDCGVSPTISDALTLEAWVKPDIGSGDAHILDCGGGWSDDGYSMMWRGTTLRLELQNTAAGAKTVCDNAVPDDGTWHHFAATWDKVSGILTVYVDGVPAANTGVFTESVGTPTRNLTIGGNQSRSRYLAGHIAEVRVFATARSEAEINGAMNHRLWGDEDGLVGYWKLDRLDSSSADRNRALDSSSSNRHGQRNGTTWTVVNDLNLHAPRTLDATLACAGDGGSLQISNTSILNGSAGTVELWFYVQQSGNGHHDCLLSTGTYWTQVGTEDELYLVVDNAALVFSYESNNTRQWSVSGGTVSAGRWHHVAATWDLDTTTVTLYLDGIQVDTGAFSAMSIADWNDRVRLGRHVQTTYDPAQSLAGCVAEVRSWRIARSADDIEQTMYRRLLGNESELTAYFPLSAGYGDEIRDRVGNVSAALDNASWAASPELALHEPGDKLCLELSGAGQYVAIDQLVYSGAGEIAAITVEAWVKVNSDSQEIIASWDRSEYWRLAVGNDVGKDQRRVFWSTKAPSSHHDMVGTIEVADGQWHFISATYDASTRFKRIFVDGVLDSEVTVHAGEGLGSGVTRYGFIGTGSEASEFDGGQGPAGCDARIDEVRIWNVARTEAEIKANRTSRLWGDETGLVGYWRFDSAFADGQIEDMSGNGHHGTLIQGAYVTDNALALTAPQPRANAVLSFVNAGDTVDCGDILPADSYSKEAWIRPSVASGQQYRILSDSTGMHALLIRSDGKLAGGHHGTWSAVKDSAAVVANVWTHVALTYDAGSETMRLYKNGLLVSEATGVTALTGSSLPVALAATNATNGFLGDLSDVRIWQTARSVDDIQVDMNTRLWGSEDGLVAYYPLSAGDHGNTLAADATGAHGADIKGPVWRSGDGLDLAPPTATNNPVFWFDGVDDYAIHSLVSPWTPTAFTIECWVNPVGAQANYAGIFHVRDGNGANSFQLDFNAGTYRFNHKGGHFTIGAVTSGWQHLAVSYDGSALVTYVDGSEYDRQSASLNTEVYHFVLGRNRNSDTFFQGEISDVRVWSAARTAEDIAASRSHRLWGTEDGLLGYWKLDQESAAITDATGNAHDLAVHGARSQSSTLEFAPPTFEPATASDAAASFDLSEMVAGASDASGTPGWLTAQFADYQLPDWLDTLIAEVENCFDGGTSTLRITTDTFSEFSLFSTISDLGLSGATLLEIGNFAIELTGVGVSFSNDLSASATVGLRISGDVSYLGLFNTTTRLEFSLSSNKKVGVVKIDSDATLSIRHLLAPAGGSGLPDSIADVLDVLADIDLTEPAFAFANNALSANNSDDAPFNLGVAKGINFYGTLDFSRFSASGSGFNLSYILSYLAGFLGLKSVQVHGGLRKESGSYYLTLDIVIATDLDIFTGKSFNMSYVGCTIGLSMSGTPPEPSLSMTNTLRLTLDYIGANDLLLSGTTKTEVESITSAYSLQQSPGADSVWHPFNYSKISVESLAVQFGATYAAPWVDNLGFAANDVTVGDVTGSLAILIDTNDPDEFVFVLSVNRLTLSDVVTVMCPLILLSDGVPAALNQLLDVSVKDLDIQILPSSTYIGTILYDPPGVTLAGDLEAWGWGGTVDMTLNKSSVDMYATMDRFSLDVDDVTLLAISGFDTAENPLLTFYLGADIHNFDFAISASVTLLGVTQSLYITADTSGLMFAMEMSAAFMDGTLTCTLDDTAFAASGSLSVDLDMTVPLSKAGVSVGDIRLKTSMDAQLALTCQRDPISCTVALDGTFKFQGATLSIPTLTLGTPPANLNALLDEIHEHILNRADTIFADYIDDLTDWANDVADAVIWFGGEVGDVALHVYRQAEDIGIAAYETVSEGVESVARGLRTTYTKAETGTAIALKAAGYAADEVTAGLKSAYNATEETIANALRGAGYAADEVAGAMVSVYKSTEDTVEDALKSAGYASSEISDALESSFKSVGKKLNPSKW